ncbi:hypothetical protein EDD17DRAFT_175756 [Pisolithus thermaeus]|nr:hypothetical protein EDD17DRAFT_175756 [Pisolithus thermaeus]
MGRTLNISDTEAFVLESGDVVEFLDTSVALVHGNMLQSWDPQPGKCYQIMATTQDGLWRHLIDNIFHVTGFDPRSGSPVSKFYGWKNLPIWFPYTTITEAHLVSVIRALNSEDIMKVQEFTRPRAKIARQAAFKALVVTHEQHRYTYDIGHLCLPAIRIVKPRIFAEYQLWRSGSMNVGVGQVKVPVVMSSEDQQEWMGERAITEL